MAELRLEGRAASPGLAEGLVTRLHDPTALRRDVQTPEAEAEAFRSAVETARADLASLATATTDAGAADMLGFQLAVLDDDALLEPVLAAIEAGEAADVAWSRVVEAEIVMLSESGDDTFAARAADYRDLRDRVLSCLVQTEGGTVQGAGAILVGRDLGPSVFLGLDWAKGGGIAIAEGSPASHVAMLARARGVPMVTGLGERVLELSGRVLLDGVEGVLVGDPSPETRSHFEARQEDAAQDAAEAGMLRTRPATTADGTPISVLVNLGDPDELDRLDPAICDGAGLVRTEFLFHGQDRLPDEERQLAALARIVAWAQGRPVTLRTLDAGGDKPIAGLTSPGESNPFLGLRGIRLSLARPDVFRVQLRAMLRAAALGPVKVMLPMVAVPAELETARALLHEEAASLAGAGIAHRIPPLGIMVEVPAAALALERFDAAFFSIGSNDLTQYTMAAARDIGSVAALNDPLEPAVLRLVAETVSAANRMGREVTLCGDAGGDPRAIPALLAAGLRALSMAPEAIGRAKRAIGRWRSDAR